MFFSIELMRGVQWLSGSVLDSRPRGRGFVPHQGHCIVSLSKNINPNIVLVQPRKTRPFITERLLMGRKESNQTNNQIDSYICFFFHRERQERQQQSQGRQHTQGQAREAQAGLVSIFFKPIISHTVNPLYNGSVCPLWIVMLK